MQLRFRPRPPYDFDLSASTFSRSGSGTQSFSEGSYFRVLRLPQAGGTARTPGRLYLVRVRSQGTVARPRLEATVSSGSRLSAAAEALRHQFVEMFKLRLDLEPFYDMARTDAVLGPVTARLQGLKPLTAPTAHEALVNVITEQQITLSAAWSMQRRLIQRFGDRLSAPGYAYRAFPTPERLASLTVKQLRDCGLSTRKAEYVIATSAMVVSGSLDLEAMKKLPDDEALARLTSVRGIGRWTAEMTMLRGMGKLAVLPADDLGLRGLIASYYGSDENRRADDYQEKRNSPADRIGAGSVSAPRKNAIRVSADEARAIAEPWGPWKGLAIYYLLVARMEGLAP